MADRDLRIRVLLDAMDRVSAPLRRVAGGAGSTGKRVKALRDELKRLNQAQGDVRSFRELKAGLQGTQKAMLGAKSRAQELGRQIAATEAPTRKMAAEFKRAKAASAELEAKHRSQVVELQKVRSRLAEAGIETGKLVSHERRLREETARTNGELREQHDRLAALAKRAAAVEKAKGAYSRSQAAASRLAIGGAATMAAGGALASPLLAAGTAAGDYESSLTDVGQKADMNRGQRGALGKRLAAMGGRVNQGPAKMVEGMDVLTGLGLDAKRAEAALEPIGRAATAYKAEISELGAASYAAVDNLKVPVAETGKVLDVMALTGKRGAFEIRDMAQYFPSLTAAAQGLGQSGVPAVADLAAALQITRKGAGDSAEAATNLGNLLQKIAAPGTVKAFKKMGVDLEADMKRAAEAGKTPIEAITELTNKTLKGDLSKLGYLFEDAQVQKALRPLMQNLEEFRAIRAEALGAKGVVNADFADRMKDGAEAARGLKTATEGLGISVGSNLLPAVTSLVTKATSAVNKVNAWTQAHPALTGAIVKVLAVLAALFVVLGALAIGLAAIIGPIALLRLGLVLAAPAFGPIVAGVRMLATGFLRLGLALLMNPMTWIILGIIAACLALAGVTYLIIKNWTAIKTFFAGLATSFLSFGRAIIDGMINGIKERLAPLRSLITSVANMLPASVRSALGIHSPSRVFAAIGGHAMAGLQQGLAGGEGGPLGQVRATAGRLAAAMVLGAAAPAAAGQTPASPPAGNSYTFNIYPSAGMDERALAKFIRQQIENLGKSPPPRGGYDDDAD